MTTDENHYVVRLKVIIGEYEKEAIHLVSAINAHEANFVAIQEEAHDSKTLEWDTLGAMDLGGEFFYRAMTTHKVEPEHLDALRCYLSGIPLPAPEPIASQGAELF